MTPYLAPEIVGAFRGDHSRLWFFRLGTEPALHLTLGVNDVPIIVPGLDAPGTVYRGCGILNGLPDLEVLVNGLASRATFELNGLDGDATDLVFDGAPDVVGALVTVGVAALDDRWQPLSPIVPLWTGTGDKIGMREGVESDVTRDRLVGLRIEVSAGDTSRHVAQMSTYTDSSQRLLFPNDTFFARMARYVPGLSVTWPRF